MTQISGQEVADEPETSPVSSDTSLEASEPVDAEHDDFGRTESAPRIAGAAPAGGSDFRSDDALSRVETAIETGVGRLLEAFERKLAYDASKQLQVDRLHGELQEHRAGLINRAVRPIVNGMIRLHDDIGKLVSALRSKPAEELSPERFFALLDGLQEDVEMLLAQNGIEAYRQPTGVFDPRRQRALRTVGTHDSQLAGHVAETLRPGFEQGPEIIEKERVSVYKVEPLPATTPGEAAPTETEPPQTPIQEEEN